MSMLVGEALEAVPVAELEDPEESLLEDRGIHLRSPQHAILEGNGYLLDLEAKTVGGVLHLDLEGIALEVYFGKDHRLEYSATIADEASRRVLDRHEGDEAHVERSPIAHEDAIQRPVLHTATTGIA